MPKSDDFLKSILPETRAIMLLCPDRIRLEDTRLQILKKIGIPEKGGRVYYADEIKQQDIRKIKNDLLNSSLFEPTQVVEIRRIDLAKQPVVDEILNNDIANGNTNLLFISGSALKSNSRIKSHFKKVGVLLDLPAIKANDLPKWAVERAKSYKLKIGPSEAQLLVQISENNTDRLDALIAHLSLYVDTDKATNKDILDLFFAHPEPNEFQLIEQAVNNPILAQKTLAELLSQGKNAFLLLNLIGKTLSKLLTIKAMLDEKHPPSEIQHRLNIPEWLFNKQLKLLSNFSSLGLKALIETTLAADSRLKNTSLSTELVIVELLNAINKNKINIKRAA